MFFYVSIKDDIEPILSLKYIINDAKNSIKNQSFKDPYLPYLDTNNAEVIERNPKNNLDGYAILFKTNNGKMRLIKSVNAMINNKGELDENLLKKIQNSRSNYTIIFIRNNSYKDIYPNKRNNVQPFFYNKWFFTNNGGFTEYFDSMKKALSNCIDYKYLKIIGSDLDSKILFALILSNMKKKNISFESLKQDFTKIINMICDIKPKKFNITLNLILSNPKINTHIALRYRTCEEIPASLYYNNDFEKGFAISSEPINYEEKWNLLENQLLIIINNELKIYDMVGQKC